MCKSSPVFSSDLHIHWETTAIPSPALAQPTTPSAESTWTRPSTAIDVTAPDRLKLQPRRPECPGPTIQSWPESSVTRSGSPVITGGSSGIGLAAAVAPTKALLIQAL